MTWGWPLQWVGCSPDPLRRMATRKGGGHFTLTDGSFAVGEGRPGAGNGQSRGRGRRCQLSDDDPPPIQNESAGVRGSRHDEHTNKDGAQGGYRRRLKNFLPLSFLPLCLCLNPPQHPTHLGRENLKNSSTPTPGVVSWLLDGRTHPGSSHRLFQPENTHE